MENVESSNRYDKVDTAYAVQEVPSWSCCCVLIGDDRCRYSPYGARGIFALENCSNCDGHGFMPVPPSEVERC
jgi:hypothetical protein